MKTIISYLKQPSTWRGIIGIVSVLGIAISPEQTAAIVTAGVSIIGAIEVFRNESKK